MAEKGMRGLVVPYLKAWRLHRVMTQDELASAADVARGTVIRGERDEPISVANVRKLAGALGVTPQQLVNEAPGAAKKVAA